MTTDVSLTLNALSAKESGRDVRRTAETQAATSSQEILQITGTSQGKGTTRTEGSDSVSSPEPTQVQKEELKGAVNQMQDFAQMLNRELQFAVDEDLGRTVVKVVDKESGDLIRQIPSDEILELAKQMKELHDSNIESVDGTSYREQPVGFLMKTQA